MRFFVGTFIEVFIISLPLLAIYWIIAVSHARRRRVQPNWLRLVLISGLYLDVIYIIWNTILVDALSNPIYFHGNINLVPLVGIIKMAKAIYHTENRWSIINLFGNIFLFIPFGLLLPILFHGKVNFWKTLLAGFLFSLSIEVFQLFLPRAFDIDDLILNFTGTVIGGVLFLLLKWILPKLMQKVCA